MNLRQSTKFIPGDRVRGQSNGIYGREGIVLRVRTSYPTHSDYVDLTTDQIIYEVTFGQEKLYLLQGHQLVDCRQQMFGFMYEKPENTEDAFTTHIKDQIN